jgi:hypothetical protein
MEKGANGLRSSRGVPGSVSMEATRTTPPSRSSESTGAGVMAAPAADPARAGYILTSTCKPSASAVPTAGFWAGWTTHWASGCR